MPVTANSDDAVWSRSGDARLIGQIFSQTRPADPAALSHLQFWSSLWTHDSSRKARTENECSCEGTVISVGESTLEEGEGGGEKGAIGNPPSTQRGFGFPPVC